MIVTQILIIVGCLTGATSDSTSDDATDVVRAWLNAHESVEAVKFEFTYWEFDHCFHHFRKSKGEGFYESPNSSYFSLIPFNDEKLSPILKNRHTYQPGSRHAVRWIWENNDVIPIDEEAKTYQKFSRFSDFFGCPLFLSMRNTFPFTPLMKEKFILSEWSFRLESEDDKEYRIRALPKGEMDKFYSSCDLIIQKTDMSLSAVRYSGPGNHSERVLVFSNVTPNPAKMQPLDDSDYSDISIVQSDNQKPEPAEFNLASAITSSVQLLVCFSKSLVH